MKRIINCKVLTFIMITMLLCVDTTNAQAPVSKPERQTTTQQKPKNKPSKDNQTQSRKQVISGTINGHDYVDLGLSVKWATCNIGGSNPSDYGNYFAWGETSPKSTYTIENSAWYDSNESVLQRLKDRKGRLNNTYDAASKNWGGSWGMPTANEMKELLNRCQWDWTTEGGHNGYKVTGPNGNSIFLPATGYRSKSDIINLGTRGDYWSSTYSNDNCAYLLYFTPDVHNWISNGRGIGRSIRPVTE